MRVLFAICVILGSLGSSFVHAESTLPAGCQAVAVKGESVILKSKSSKLVYIHNLVNSDLWLTHPEDSPSANAGWTTRLQADKWSALTVDKPPFELTCIESKPGHEQQIPCEGVVAVCQWKGVKVPSGNSGTFWVGEDMSLEALTAAIGGRGFVVPTPK